MLGCRNGHRGLCQGSRRLGIHRRQGGGHLREDINETLPKALRTKALTALTSNFGLVGLIWWVWFGGFGLVGLVW